MSRAFAVLILALLAACATTPPGPVLPDGQTAVQPVVRVIERYVYVPITPDLTGLEPVAEGPLSQCPQVAAQRRAALEKCNAKLSQIAAQQGTAVDPEADAK